MRALFVVAVVLLAACQSSTVAQAPAAAPPFVAGSGTGCTVGSLSVTGAAGESVVATVPPAGMSPEALVDPTALTFSGPEAQTWLEVSVYHTNVPIDSLVAGGPKSPITIQGRGGKILVTGPAASPDVDVMWAPQPGIGIIVLGRHDPLADVLAVAQHLQYTPGTPFTYPNHVTITVNRARALSILPGAASAVLTSFGEAETVLEHIPAAVPAIRPVWVVSRGQRAVIVDAVSGQRLTATEDETAAALASLTDRSTARCEPAFGMLTRTEFMHLRPALAGTNSTVKLVTLQLLRTLPEAGYVGGCDITTCDPNEPLWVLVESAPDCSLLLRCAGPLPSDPQWFGATWSLVPLDARTGPPISRVGYAMGGHGAVPADVAALPDLDRS